MRPDLRLYRVRIKVGIIDVFPLEGQRHGQFPRAGQVCADGSRILRQLHMRPRRELAGEPDDELLEAFDPQEIVGDLERAIPGIGRAPSADRIARQRPVTPEVIDESAEPAIDVGTFDAQAEAPPEDFDLVVHQEGSGLQGRGALAGFRLDLVEEFPKGRCAKGVPMLQHL